VIFRPEHTVFEPEIVPGAAMTVIVLVAAIPQPVEYVIVALPATPPVTTPLDVPTVATDVLFVLHVPPAVASLSVIFEPEHTDEAPDMVPGAPITVIVVVTALPQPVEYEITALPAITPVTMPVPEPTVAVVVLLLLHVPLVVELLNVMIEVEHTIVAPDIVPGAARTVIVLVASVPQPVE
jgi:hypothetical protein